MRLRERVHHFLGAQRLVLEVGGGLDIGADGNEVVDAFPLYPMPGEEEKTDVARVFRERLPEGDEGLVHLLPRGVGEELHGIAQLPQGRGQIGRVIRWVREARQAGIRRVADDEGIAPALGLRAKPGACEN